MMMDLFRFRRCWRGLVTGLFLLLGGQSLPADPAQGVAGFEYQAELTAGQASLRRVALNWEVLAVLRQSGQADLRVYNADNQPVPFSIRQRNAVWTELSEQRELNFFSGDNASHLAQLAAQQQQLSRRQINALAANNRHYLIIPTQVTSTLAGSSETISTEADVAGLSALQLDWGNLQQWLPKSLRLERSDDLLQWQPVQIESLPYMLSERGERLENRLIRLQQPVYSKFIRLSGGQDFTALLVALQNVQGHYQQSHQQAPALNWQTVALEPGEKPQQYRYDPPPGLTLLQWRLALSQPGYLYSGKVYSRRAGAVTSPQQQPDWRYLRRFQQYHLQTAAGVVRSAAEPAGQLLNRQWLLAFDQPLTRDTAPQLEVAWQPLDVYFIAQGKGSFRLVYGSRQAQAVSMMQLDETLMAGAEQVQIAQVVRLSAGNNDASVQPINWLVWLLWGVLGVSVVFLLWMAKRLWREMSGKQDVGTE